MGGGRLKHARYQIVEDQAGKPLLIRDEGPWDQHPSVTNDAEHVVLELDLARKLSVGRRLFYVDSEGREDEILHKDGRFLGFAPGPRGAGRA